MNKNEISAISKEKLDGKSLVSVNVPSLFLESVSNGTQKFSAGPSEFLPDLHFLCKIVLKPSNVIPLLLF